MFDLANICPSCVRSSQGILEASRDQRLVGWQGLAIKCRVSAEVLHRSFSGLAEVVLPWTVLPLSCEIV